MTVGSKTHKGLAVPLYGESVITGQTAATDVLTITGASAQSGDYLVVRNTNGTELLYIESAGDINLVKHNGQTAFAKLNLALLATTPTSAAGCKTGDLWLHKCTTDVYALAICQSGAATTIKRMRRHFDVTLGSAS